MGANGWLLTGRRQRRCWKGRPKCDYKGYPKSAKELLLKAWDPPRASEQEGHRIKTATEKLNLAVLCLEIRNKILQKTSVKSPNWLQSQPTHCLQVLLKEHFS